MTQWENQNPIKKNIQLHSLPQMLSQYLLFYCMKFNIKTENPTETCVIDARQITFHYLLTFLYFFTTLQKYKNLI